MKFQGIKFKFVYFVCRQVHGSISLHPTIRIKYLKAAFQLSYPTLYIFNILNPFVDLALVRVDVAY